MRIAALYDIHGNLPALEATLAEVRAAGVDRVIVGGDVLPGPMPRECLDLLLDLDLPVDFIHGNGDREVLSVLRGREPDAVPEAFRELIRWNARQLDPREARALETWPPTLRIDVPSLGPVLFCHATPRSDVEIFTRKTADERLRLPFAGVDAAVVVCGHTHMPFERRLGTLRIVNAGSVGMPFGHTGAAWLLLGPDLEPRRTDYDLSAAAARIRATSYPAAETFAAAHVQTTPSEAEMLAVFDPAEP